MTHIHPYIPPRAQSPAPANKIDLNFNSARQTDAMTGIEKTERRTSVRFLKKQENSSVPKLSRESPVVELSPKELLRSKARFLVETGADINVIKLDALDEDLLVDENEAIEITGITQSRISTIGTVNIELVKSKITF